MKYVRYEILTTTAAEDFISMMCMELGATGVEIENNVPLTAEELGKMFVDFPPELSPDDGSSVVSFYVEESRATDEFLRELYDGIEEQRQFADVGAGTIKVGEAEDSEWLNNWKQYFHAFTIGDILIRPTWEEADASGKTEIVIDPGISFGTGKHETTRLCIEALQSHLKAGDTLLDVGCGSGILSIVALKLGASHVVGTDIDENCLSSTAENFAVNGLSEETGEFYCGNLIDDEALRELVGKQPFDVITANILADVIIPMAPVFPRLLKDRGKLIVSGIIDFKEDEVKEALNDVGLSILTASHDSEWVGIVAEKP